MHTIQCMALVMLAEAEPAAHYADAAGNALASGIVVAVASTPSAAAGVSVAVCTDANAAGVDGEAAGVSTDGVAATTENHWQACIRRTHDYQGDTPQKDGKGAVQRLQHTRDKAARPSLEWEAPE